MPHPPQELALISHNLCPYVQRAVIALTEKHVTFERVDIDLANKPAWFLAISPLGKTPVLRVGAHAIFESAVILEYLEETQPAPLHPTDPLARAEHRGWIEFSSTVLNGIAALYNAGDQNGFEIASTRLEQRFARLEEALADGPWFAAEAFSLVDVAFAPVFRYFDLFDEIADFGILRAKPCIGAWRTALAGRASVRSAAARTYQDDLRHFLIRRESFLSRLLTEIPEAAGFSWKTGRRVN